MKPEFLIPLFCLLSWQTPALTQEERILNYDTQIEVQEDRSVVVTEYIEVNVTGDLIKRGITRNLPTERSLNGRIVQVKYQIKEIEKNDVPEPYHQESSGGELVLYLDSSDVFL
ncbi:MAG: DUF2207 domain-containing protein, partial [Saprospiraceae bacterium]|nr:DUF2207 domain-containing protein [Saprospiraceae bacterium]